MIKRRFWIPSISGAGAVDIDDINGKLLIFVESVTWENPNTQKFLGAEVLLVGAGGYGGAAWAHEQLVGGGGGGGGIFHGYIDSRDMDDLRNIEITIGLAATADYFNGIKSGDTQFGEYSKATGGYCGNRAHYSSHGTGGIAGSGSFIITPDESYIISTVNSGDGATYSNNGNNCSGLEHNVFINGYGGLTHTVSPSFSCGGGGSVGNGGKYYPEKGGGWGGGGIGVCAQTSGYQYNRLGTNGGDGMAAIRFYWS